MFLVDNFRIFLMLHKNYYRGVPHRALSVFIRKFNLWVYLDLRISYPQSRIPDNDKKPWFYDLSFTSVKVCCSVKSAVGHCYTISTSAFAGSHWSLSQTTKRYSICISILLISARQTCSFSVISLRRLIVHETNSPLLTVRRSN